MSYITLSELRAYIGASATTDDALLTTLITAAQAIIESPVGAGRVYEASADTTRYFDPTVDVDGQILYFGDDLAQVTSITNGDGATVSASDYVLERTMGRRGQPPYQQARIKAGASVSWTYSGVNPENTIAVVGRWAYSVTPPERIKQYTREIAAYLYRSRAAAGDASTDRPLLTGDGVTLMARRLPSDVLAGLKAERTVT